VLPVNAAQCSADSPPSLRARGSAPASSSSRAQAGSSGSPARCSAVSPVSVRARRFEPASISRRTSACMPFSAAACSGVSRAALRACTSTLPPSTTIAATGSLPSAISWNRRSVSVCAAGFAGVWAGACADGFAGACG
jgi:hypothetical protein